MKKLWFIVLIIIAMRIMAFADNDKKINPEKSKAEQWIKTQPVRFLENKGQLADDKGNPVPFVLFKAVAQGMDMYITEKGLTYLFLKMEEEDNDEHDTESSEKTEEEIRYNRIDMDLKGATIKRENIIKEFSSVTSFNYFYPHCPDGLYNVKQYEKITIKNIYPDIDWVLYNSDGKGFKYDFVVRPHANPSQIKLIYRSEKELSLQNDGSLFVKTEFGTLTENAPECYSDERKEKIASRFIKTKTSRENETEVNFEIENYDPSQTLVIDPQLVWSTFYGGNNIEGPLSADCDAAGNVYVSGYTNSSDFPVQNPGGSTYFDGVIGGSADISILKFTNAGVLLWATYYGGMFEEYGWSINCDINSNVFVTGYTGSLDFPTFNPGGSAYYQGVNGGPWDGFILKFDNAGVRQWATYYGGTNMEGDGYRGASVASDNSGNIFVTGYTTSGNFPTLNPGGGAYFDATLDGYRDAYILKFDNTGTPLWATYYGGSSEDWGYSIACDNNNDILITGNTRSGDLPVSAGAFQSTLNGGATYGDAFILKFDNAGVPLWATYYGGTGEDVGSSVTSDNNTNVLVTGRTASANFPLQNPGGGAYYDNTLGGTWDAYILKLGNNGTPLWSSLYGGSNAEAFYMSINSYGTFDNIVTDTCDNVYIAFQTLSANLTTLNPGCGSYYSATYGGGGGINMGDIFLVKFDDTGALLWGTYWGGTRDDYRSVLSVDGNNNLFMAGEWISYPSSAGLPLSDPGGGAYYDDTPNTFDDGFIAKFIPTVINHTVAGSGSCLPCTGTATVTPSCTSSYSYVWSTSPVQTTQIATGLCAGVYSVTVPGSCGAAETLTVSISNSSMPVGINGITTVCTGQSTTLTASGGASYSWNTGSSATSIIVTPTANTSYTVSGTDSNGCVSTTSVTVTIISGPVINITGTTSICNGSTTLTASGGVSYSWSTLATTTSIAVSPTANTNYTVTGTDISGCTNTATIAVTMGSSPAITISGNTTICNGQNTTLTASGGVSYSWNTSATTTSIVVNPSVNTSYTVTGTDAGGCTNTSTVAITVSSGPAITSTPASSTICPGTSVTLTAGGGTTYSWNTAQTINPITVSPTGTSTYTVIGTDANGCTGSAVATVSVTPTPVVASSAATICSGNATTLTASGGVSYNWSPGNMTTAAITVSPTINTTYTVVVTAANACTNSTTASVTVNPTPVITIVPAATTVCAGSSVTLTAGGGVTYLWSNAQTVNPMTVFPSLGTSTYSVIATDANGCSNTASATVTATSSPTITIAGATTICPGNSATLTATGGISYSWSTTQTSNPITVSPAGTTTYTVIGTDAGGCTNIQTATVTQSALAAGVTVVNASCLNNDGSATASGSGGTLPYNYSWNPSGQTTATATGLGGITLYTVTITDANGCSLSTIATVSVNPGPTANAGVDVTINEGNSTTLSVNAAGGTSYSWSTGATTALITVSPSTTTTYSVIVTDANGCTATDVVTVFVKEDCSKEGELYLPNAFSPNDDGENDVLQLYYKDIDCIKEFQLIIYDRWGEKVFYSKDAEFAWDGQYKKMTENSAVFVYYMTATLISEEKIERKGNLSVIR